MEKSKTENKSEKLYIDLKAQLTMVGDMINDSMDLAIEAKQEVFKGMTQKERDKHEAFEKKYIHLMQEGKVKEALKLKNKYLNE